MGIESQGSSTLASGEKGDEREFESEFTHAGVEAMDAADSNDTARKKVAFQKLEALFTTPDVQELRLPGEDEVYLAYAKLAEQLSEEPKFRINENGDIETIAPTQGAA